MFRLAGEMVAAGGRVITTTTTRIFQAQIALAPRHYVAGESSLGDIAGALAEAGHVLVTGHVDGGEGKALGVPMELIGELRALPGQPTILVEADGSRMRPFKAPAEHEPMIPADTTLVVPVVGADVFGAALDDERVHRAARVAALAGAAEGEPVTPALVAAVIAHPLGGLKGVPAAARVIAFVNKVEGERQRAQAAETAARLLAHERITAVVQGAARRDPPADLTWGRVGAVVLAAGQSTRMGRTKQLLPWGPHSIVGAVVRSLQTASLAPVVVVTGREREAVEASVSAAQIPDRPPVTFVFNPDFAHTEMARSLQLGLDGLPPNCLAAFVALGDQPQLQPDVLARVQQRWRETQAPIVAPFYRGQRGHPILFDQAVWPAVRALPPDANPRQLLQTLHQVEQVAVETDTILRDVDTPDDYAREAARWSAAGKLV
jgi:molybdenum cofactor cytidylyltransferase